MDNGVEHVPSSQIAHEVRSYGLKATQNFAHAHLERPQERGQLTRLSLSFSAL